MTEKKQAITSDPSNPGSEIALSALPPRNDKHFYFEVTAKDPSVNARTGIVHTVHGDFETPVFMPVGTQGTVKALTPRDLDDAGAEIILGNAYHLFLRPGLEIIEKFGGLHDFMGWKKPILTDSGGYQVFSLSRLRRISDEGVTFSSHYDGSEIVLTPEKMIRVQEIIGSDIAMIFDECPPPTLDQKRIREAVDRTITWSEAAKKAHQKKTQALFGIIQGGVFEEIRRNSLERTVEIGFDGYAVGGLCVGESREQTLGVLDKILPEMPEDKPRYLMGVGTPIDFLESVERGADMFDCVNPTRYGRNGAAFTRTGMIVVRNSKYSRDERPLDESCGCYACGRFSRAYLRHLLNAEEMLGPQLVSIHNVFFFVQFVREIRQAIREKRFVELKKNFMKHFDRDCR